MRNADLAVKMGKKRKKIEIFSIFDWKTGLVYAILMVLFAQNSLRSEAGEVHREGPKPAWQLEKELDALKRETEKKLAVLTNERDRLRSQVKDLQEENSLNRKELIETLEKYSMLAEKLKRLERSAAAVIETLKPEYTDVRADETAESLRTVMQSSVALASASAALCEEVTKLIQLPGTDEVHAAKLRVMINNIKSLIRDTVRYNAAPAMPQGFTSCRILKLDEPLKAAVFSAGYRDGLRAGMVLRTPDGKTRFQVIMLRDFTSAGMLLSGEFGSVSIGSELRASGEPTAK